MFKVLIGIIRVLFFILVGLPISAKAQSARGLFGDLITHVLIIIPTDVGVLLSHNHTVAA